MAATYRPSSVVGTNSANTNVATLSVTVPAGVVAADYCFAFYEHLGATGTVTDPGGKLALLDGPLAVGGPFVTLHGGTGYKAGDTLTLNCTITDKSIMAVFWVMNHNGIDVQGADSVTGSAGTSLVVNAVTSLSANATVFTLAHSDSSSATTINSVTQGAIDATSTASINFGVTQTCFAICEAAKTTAGSSGTNTVGASTSSSIYGIQIAMKPAATTLPRSLILPSVAVQRASNR